MCVCVGAFLLVTRMGEIYSIFLNLAFFNLTEYPSNTDICKTDSYLFYPTDVP